MARKGLYGTLACLIAMTLGVAQAGAAASAPCGAPQITDPEGDGHHHGTDVLSAWFSEAAGRLQAVIKVESGYWVPDHPPDSAQYALLFDAGGATRFVRATAAPSGALSYDYGTWNGSTLVPAGPTSGAVVHGAGGTVTIDIPVQTGAVAGAVLGNPFVLTYDGDGLIDRAPGGTTLDSSAFGASYRVGPCGGGGGGGGPGVSVSSVGLSSRSKLVGGGTITVKGTVAPARGGVPVELTVKTTRSVLHKLTTAADGSFSKTIRVSETTSLRAVAAGIASQTQTVTVKSKVRLKVRRLKGRAVLLLGTVRPKVPGRVLLLRTTSPTPSASKRIRKGRFSFRFKNLRRGTYQAVFIPFKGRAERATSNRGVIR